MQSGKFCTQNPQPFSRDAIRPAAFFRRQRLNPALLLQPRNCPIERPRTQMSPAQALNVFYHRVPVFRSIGKAGKHKQGRVGIMPHPWSRLGFYYV